MALLSTLLIGSTLGLSGAVEAWTDPSRLRAACDSAAHFEILHPASSSAAIEAQAIWLDRRRLRWPQAEPGARFRLYHSALVRIQAAAGAPVSGADGAIELDVSVESLPQALERRFAWFGDGPTLRVRDGDLATLDAQHASQWLLVQEASDGRVQQVTQVQIAAALDDRYAAATALDRLGARPGRDGSRFELWAPTARQVHVCLYPDPQASSTAVLSLRRRDETGSWVAKHEADLRGQYYLYLVDVVVPGLGLVRNRVSDPYALSLSADSRRGYIADLNDSRLKPKGWDQQRAPTRVQHASDMVIYELHVRDFSRDDASVLPAHRGRYTAFTQFDSAGMRHLRALAEAGLTDVHLLPVFDFASVPESNCLTPDITGSPDSSEAQAIVAQYKDRDCFNWGYDPLHYSAPEGSYASDADDGAARIIEFRQMVMALHRAGLRVGMDVVYNHTHASGQDPRSILDRIVPGYYHRLNSRGEVETSTCCANTATENAMMAKLMIDSAVIWARDYRIDSFRFDLMGHQPRAAMEALQAAVNQAAGREVQLIGEGWNFGEVADGRRFVQAAQGDLNGSGIASFNDRTRDAVRGGGCCDSGAALTTQGFVTGLSYAANSAHHGTGQRQELLQAADLVRAGLAGSLRDYRLRRHNGNEIPLSDLPYADNQTAGYVSQPGEVVNYVENHDNQTLFDVGVLKLPLNTSMDDRARVQILAAAITAFSQGIAYYHAGIDVLRSKSLDRNSYDSGDWFNPLDWSYQDNGFGRGLPPAWDNEASWPVMRPRLVDPTTKPDPAQILWTRDAFRDLLRIRASSSLFRLRSATDIQQRLRFLNTGPEQIPTLIAARLDGRGYPGARFAELLYFINVDSEAAELIAPELAGKAYRLHPVHRAETAADARPLGEAEFDSETGRMQIPARTAMVLVLNN